MSFKFWWYKSPHYYRTEIFTLMCIILWSVLDQYVTEVVKMVPIMLRLCIQLPLTMFIAYQYSFFLTQHMILIY